MRRHWLCLAMLPGLLLPRALWGGPKRPHGGKTHVSGAAAVGARPRFARHEASRHHAGSSTTGHAAVKRSRVARTAVPRRAGSGPAPLQTTEPVRTALIDPVPRGHFPMPLPLKGSHDSLVRQNARAEADGLTRIQDDADLLSMRRSGELVGLPASAALIVDERLPADRRYCRNWTARFLTDLSRVHYGRFHRALQVNSAVRTVEYQRHLERVNGNAAPAEGEDASPHLTGATIDIAKKGLSMEEVGWMRAYLQPLQAAGKIDVEEEFYQACFHITVYRSYLPEAKLIEARAAGNAHPARGAALLAARVR